ncbi:hypothetical protein G5V59_18155 [Nocardioides sp. W3-2-3]|uniref:hypothetical protein n=1 Tax=Nocardioides convexus TaxID=2712224 RepID=UPI002418B02A|nr:hypothetical protein [Nocardioides convexus]NHA01140.1 hypothetical protein [Nocardioides convexus]
MHRTRRAVLALTTLAATGLVAGDLGAGGAPAGDACASYTIPAEDLGGRDEAFATDVIATCYDGDGVTRTCEVGAPGQDGDLPVTCRPAD